MCALGQGLCYVGFLVETETRDKNRWRGLLFKHPVDEIEETLVVIVLKIVTKGKEGRWDPIGKADRVLNVQVLRQGRRFMLQIIEV